MKETLTAIILLAAGASSRMGRPKQMLPWGESTLLQNAIIQAEASHADFVLVVLGANSKKIKSTLPKNVSFVENTDWQAGMGSSIACGIRFVLTSKLKYSSILIMLGDQPFMDSEYINKMIVASKEVDKGIIATTYSGRAGVPALFSSKYFPQLAELNSEVGAKELLAEYVTDIHLLNAGHKTTDIDTKEDYQKFNI